MTQHQKYKQPETRLVVQWTHLPVQGMQVWSLVQEDSTCWGATAALVPRLLGPGTWSLCSVTREAPSVGSRGTAAGSSPRPPQQGRAASAPETQHSREQITVLLKKWLKNGRKNRIDIFPKRKCKRPTGSWKDAQHHWYAGKRKSNPQWDITSHLSEWLLLKGTQITSVGGNWRKGTLVHCVGNVNWHSYCGKPYDGFQNTKDRLAMWSRDSTPGHISERHENTNLQRYTHPSECSQQHYLQLLRRRSNLSVRWQMNG